MDLKFNSQKNYEKTRTATGYVTLAEASAETYASLGFKSGLEIHQQLQTEKKLFCRCPVGIYQDEDDFDVEVLRHMRPTLSEMGEYDGTALMERRTRKNILYRLKGENACTYEIDDTPPFPLNRDALKKAIEIALLLKSNVVGELHITRKQYLDGSIPTGFQRTAIVGVEGEITLSEKKVRMIQLSIEEDSCREVSDIGHNRVYRTDRLGMPLIEMVTYPDMVTPTEVAEAGNYLRYLSRGSGLVRTGIGAARQDVNVSIDGGTRVEIKGVAHIDWIKRLTHIEAFRQKALLIIRDKLAKSVPDQEAWRLLNRDIELEQLPENPLPFIEKSDDKTQITIVCLPGFHGILSHFIQPGKVFADEFSERLKVIACLEQPNMVHTEESAPRVSPDQLRTIAKADTNDAVILIHGDPADIDEALVTIEERCRLAFAGVPNETRKSMIDGTTMFERVLPGSDRMYPDTDSAPIKIDPELVDTLAKNLPKEVSYYQELLEGWQITSDVKHYLLRLNLMPLIERIVNDFSLSGKWVCYLLAHRVKHLQRKFPTANITHEQIYELIKTLVDRSLDMEIIKRLLPSMFASPDVPVENMLAECAQASLTQGQLSKAISTHHEKFSLYHRSDKVRASNRWIMGRLAPKVVGLISMNELNQMVLSGNSING